MEEKSYIAIDLKSFYASVECVERGLDPMTTHLVVADKSRTEKTICLAVSPALKAYGIPGRARLFEVVQRVKAINARRLLSAPGRQLAGSSHDSLELAAQPALALDYIVAPPRMALYMEASARIYSIYLKYAAPEDIHVYSIDEVFLDATDYLKSYGGSPRAMARKILLDVLDTTGITATAGIGTNLYLSKVALDIQAKRTAPDPSGVRIAELDEMSYRRELWSHRPLTDFWRVGPGYARKLEAHGMRTMGDVARCSIGAPTDYYNEELLYRLFGVNAQLLIDHAWGWESCTIADIKAYRPENSSICTGQVLSTPYPWEKTRLVVREMADQMALDLVEKGLVTDQLTLTVGYDRENLTDPQRKKSYRGPVVTDRYGRAIPKHAHGTIHLADPTSSARRIVHAVTELLERIADPALLVRRIQLTAERVVSEGEAAFRQLDLFTDEAAEHAALTRERKMQQAMLSIKRKYGKNAILKGMNLLDGATARERNGKIGGHQA